MARQAFEIPLSAEPQKFQIKLAGTLYTFRLTWNGVSQCWMLDIGDGSGNALVLGIPVVTGVDLLAPYAHLGITGGLLAQTDNSPDTPPTFSNLGPGGGRLYYVTP